MAGNPASGASSAKKWVMLAIAAFVFVLAVTNYFVKAPHRPLRVAVMTWGGAGPGFVGKEKKLFGNLDVEFYILDDTKQRQAAYQSGDFEVYLTNPDQHPKETQLGLPGKMFMLSDFSDGADGLIARPDIKDVASLRGKRVAYTQGTASDFMLSKALASAGLSRSDVHLVELDDPNTAGVALLSGEVDAAISWEPMMSQATEGGRARILFTSRDVPNAIIGVFIAKDSLLDDRPRLRSFVEGWQKSVAYYNDHQDESLAIMAKAFKVTPTDMKGMMSGLRLASQSDNAAYFVSQNGQPTKMDMFTADAAAYWKSIGLMRKDQKTPDRWVRDDTGLLYRNPG